MIEPRYVKAKIEEPSFIIGSALRATVTREYALTPNAVFQASTEVSTNLPIKASFGAKATA